METCRRRCLNEEALTAKLTLLNELIVQEILLAKARAAESRTGRHGARRGVRRGEEERSR